MKKRIAYLCFVAFSAVGGFLGTANDAQAADSGPYYIRVTGYCDVYQVYLTPTSVVYGQEIGCGLLFKLGGSFIPGRSAALGYTYQGSDRIKEFALDGTHKIWINNGTSLTQLTSGTWTFGDAPDPLLGAKTWLPSVDE